MKKVEVYNKEEGFPKLWNFMAKMGCFEQAALRQFCGAKNPKFDKRDSLVGTMWDCERPKGHDGPHVSFDDYIENRNPNHPMYIWEQS